MSNYPELLAQTDAKSVYERDRFKAALEAILRLNGDNDLPDAWTIAREALLRQQTTWGGK